MSLFHFISHFMVLFPNAGPFIPHWINLLQLKAYCWLIWNPREPQKVSIVTLDFASHSEGVYRHLHLLLLFWKTCRRGMDGWVFPGHFSKLAPIYLLAVRGYFQNFDTSSQTYITDVILHLIFQKFLPGGRGSD